MDEPDFECDKTKDCPSNQFCEEDGKCEEYDGQCPDGYVRKRHDFISSYQDTCYKALRRGRGLPCGKAHTFKPASTKPGASLPMPAITAGPTTDALSTLIEIGIHASSRDIAGSQSRHITVVHRKNLRKIPCIE